MMIQPLSGTLSPLGRARVLAASGWWLAGEVAAADCVAAYSPEGAASLAASYVNLANPGTHDAIPGQVPLLTASGWKCSNNAWLITGIAPQEGWAYLLKFSDVLAGSGWAMGTYDGSNYVGLYPQFGSTGPAYVNGGSAALAKAPTLASGVIGMTKTKAWRNGIDEGLTIGGQMPTTQIYLCALNNNGTPARFIGTVRKVAIYKTLTPAQVAAITSAM